MILEKPNHRHLLCVEQKVSSYLNFNHIFLNPQPCQILGINPLTLPYKLNFSLLPYKETPQKKGFWLLFRL